MSLSALVLASTVWLGPPSLPPIHADEQGLAKAEFDAGLDSVASGQFTAAVESFERAYALRPHPVTLFNLGLALEKAERLPEAWGVFTRLEAEVESDAERKDIARRLRAIGREIGVLEIHAPPGRRLCLDGVEMPRDLDGSSTLAVDASEHTVLLGRQAIEVDLERGSHRILLLDDASSLMGRRRGPLMPAMLGVGIGAGALAVGLGIGSASAGDAQTGRGLAAGAATSAGVAVVAGVVALVIEVRGRRAGDSAFEEEPACPGSESRVDLRLGVRGSGGLPEVPAPVRVAVKPSRVGARAVVRRE